MRFMKYEFNDYFFDFELFKNRITDVNHKAVGIAYAIYSDRKKTLCSTMNLLDFLCSVRNNAKQKDLTDGINELIKFDILIKKEVKQKA